MNSENALCRVLELFSQGYHGALSYSQGVRLDHPGLVRLWMREVLTTGLKHVSGNG